MTTLRVLVLLLVSLGSASASFATVITFEDGSNGTTASSHYAALGVSLPNWRFHDSSVFGNLAFPFIDSRGVVVDGGLGGVTGFVSFAAPIHGLTLAGVLQANELGALRQWTLTAFDISNITLGSVSGSIIGVGEPIPGTFATFLPSALSLSFSGDQISRVEVSPGGPLSTFQPKFGVDSLLFTPDIDLTPVPEPTTLLLMATTGGLGLLARHLRKHRHAA